MWLLNVAANENEKSLCKIELYRCVYYGKTPKSIKPIFNAPRLKDL